MNNQDKNNYNNNFNINTNIYINNIDKKDNINLKGSFMQYTFVGNC